MFRRLPLLIAAALMALPAAARAQTVQYTSAAGVTYRSDKDTGAVARAERALDAPVGVRVITAGEIEASAAGTLPELLSRLGDLHARNNTGSPDFQLDLRGFGYQSTTQAMADMRQSGANVVWDKGGADIVTFVNVALADMAKLDFVLG